MTTDTAAEVRHRRIDLLLGAAVDNHFCTGLVEPAGNGKSDSFGRSCNEGDFTGKVDVQLAFPGRLLGQRFHRAATGLLDGAGAFGSVMQMHRWTGDQMVVGREALRLPRLRRRFTPGRLNGD
ncbi:hypothetical protein LPU83_pLPU83d_1141 (plasmid) [Rhizobium favelukesii]|uniref:Uncharacterized protein n=1 Tax=Rhizobium favelukesii TaxID=348824 RepID=W6S8R6_9HYPH|nr:hypothetical protein LPU83_pLPU83d_1141 [Rhizobium favelukesii]